MIYCKTSTLQLNKHHITATLHAYNTAKLPHWQTTKLQDRNTTTLHNCKRASLKHHEYCNSTTLQHYNTKQHCSTATLEYCQLENYNTATLKHVKLQQKMQQYNTTKLQHHNSGTLRPYNNAKRPNLWFSRL